MSQCKVPFSRANDGHLNDAYTAIAVPSDHLVAEPKLLSEYCSTYRDRSGDKKHTNAEIAHRVITLRKNRKLSRLGRKGGA